MPNPTFRPLYPNVAEEIIRMYEQDQKMREMNIVDPDYWIENLDRENTEILIAIVNEIN